VAKTRVALLSFTAVCPRTASSRRVDVRRSVIFFVPDTPRRRVTSRSQWFRKLRKRGIRGEGNFQVWNDGRSILRTAKAMAWITSLAVAPGGAWHQVNPSNTTLFPAPSRSAIRARKQILRREGETKLTLPIDIRVRDQAAEKGQCALCDLSRGSNQRLLRRDSSCSTAREWVRRSGLPSKLISTLWGEKNVNDNQTLVRPQLGRPRTSSVGQTEGRSG